MKGAIAWARRHAHRVTAEQVAKLRAGDSLVMLKCTDEPESWEWILCLGEGFGITWRGKAILDVLDERAEATA